MTDDQRQTLRHPDGVSELVVGERAFETARPSLEGWVDARTLFVLSTPRVRELWGHALDPVRVAARRVVELEVEDGEGAKTPAHAGRLWREMVAAGGKRDSRMVTLGGGTVGDLGGFVAGCFLRGIDYAQIPTTLLAQVDAAVGGKTGVDLPEGKNTVGLFHHPSWVVADTRVLETLPRRERAAGLAEVVKMAFLLDPPLLEAVERTLETLLDGDASALAPVVAGAIAAKRRVVEDDPREGGRRMLLNFGHTLAHAIEAELDYRGLRHGEAVAYGMLFALRLSRARGLEHRAAQRLRDLIRRLEPAPLPTLDAERLAAWTARDKKAREGGLAWVLARQLGDGVVCRDIGADEVEATIQAFLADPWDLP